MILAADDVRRQFIIKLDYILVFLLLNSGVSELSRSESIEIVWACGKNGWVPYGQKDVDGVSKWRAGTRDTEVRLDGRWTWATEEWRWRLRDNEREIGKSGEPWYIYNWMSFTLPFLLGPVFFRTALPCPGCYHLERGGMSLYDAVGINCKKGATTENQGAGVKYMG